MQTQKKKLEFPNVPVKFPGRFPEGHVNDVKGWNFSQKELTEAAGGGRMLTMDLDMGGGLNCSLRCGHCINKELRPMLEQGDLLSGEEVKRVVMEAKALGLRSVKIIGPGEPLEERSLLAFLDFLAGNGITPLIFTKATALGMDSMARKIHGMKPDMLARRLREYDVSILFGATSFQPETEAMIVGQKWYPRARNRAMERLVDAGFNDFVPGQPTSLAVIFNPITRLNVDEAFDFYAWARVRHIYVVSSPTMITGPCAREEAYRRMTPPESELLDLYVKINLWAIGRGIVTVNELAREGIAAYAGARPCQQVGAGLFVRRDGLALRCPGDGVSIQGNVRERGLADIWRSSENYSRYLGMINVGCPPKLGKSIPEGFLEKVLDTVRERLRGRT